MSDRKYKFKQTENECRMNVRKLERIAPLAAKNSRARATRVFFFFQNCLFLLLSVSVLYVEEFLPMWR